jgi:3-dehydroquinate synthase
MKKVRVELGSRSYDACIGSGGLGRAGPMLKELGLSGKAVIIIDTTVRGLYGERLERSLSGAGFRVSVLEVPPGEEQKSLATAGRLYRELTGAYAERQTPVLALGGGVIGDLAGFVAATYMRGVPLVQLPTTLLAQVDSCLGGKTAVDHDGLKNVIGVFYQPRLVVADIDTLKTLPVAEMANGIAEVIKYAAIRNRELFAYLEGVLGRAASLEAAALERMVLESVKIKAEIVAIDEQDSGLRGILNYGHTIGHAIEAASGFRFRHGQAVAMGMVAAARVSRRLGMLSDDDVFRLVGLIRKASLPTEVPALKIEEIIQAMKHDKKVKRDRVRFVLLEAIGQAMITDEVSLSLVEEVLRGR